MKFTLVALASLATAVLAAPPACLTQKQANTLIGYWSAMMSNGTTSFGGANATAQAIISDDYFEVSDSVESLKNMTLGIVPTTAGKQANIAAILEYPIPKIHTYLVAPAACDKIVWYWKMTGIGGPFAPAQEEVKGINIFTIKNSQFYSSHFEFNSIAWGADIHQLPAQCYAGEGAPS